MSLLGLFSYKLAPQLGIDNFTASTISNFVLIVIVISWVSSYVLRVLNGKMTFMEQRKRYRKEYEKIVNDKLEIKFNLNDTTCTCAYRSIPIPLVYLSISCTLYNNSL